MWHFLFLWTINYFSFSHVIGFLVIPPWFIYVISPLYPPLPRPCSPVWRSSNHCCFSCWIFFFLKWRTTMQLLHKIQGYSKWLSGSYTVHSKCNPMWFLSVGLRQGSGLCSSSSHKYPGTECTNQNRHWNHHRWHVERTRLLCWCL